jgi:hypothetical protein
VPDGYRVLLAVMGSLLATAPTVKAEQIGALLTGYEEVPAVSTKAAGEFTATIPRTKQPSSTR